MKMISESTGGFLDYEDVCDKFTSEVVDSLIEYDILHVRPTATLAHDIPWHDLPIVHQSHLQLYTVVMAKCWRAFLLMQETNAVWLIISL